VEYSAAFYSVHSGARDLYAGWMDGWKASDTCASFSCKSTWATFLSVGLLHHHSLSLGLRTVTHYNIRDDLPNSNCTQYLQCRLLWCVVWKCTSLAQEVMSINRHIHQLFLCKFAIGNRFTTHIAVLNTSVYSCTIVYQQRGNHAVHDSTGKHYLCCHARRDYSVWIFNSSDQVVVP